MTSSGHAHYKLSATQLVSVMTGRRREFVRSVYGVYCIGQGNDFELIPTVKMEARNPLKGYFGSEFPRCVIIVEL